MDELLHHCLRELAFDGDLGCNVSRLKDFVVDFYKDSRSHPQNPDDAFCAFVWSLVVQQPTVLVGLIDPSITSGVWIAPQISAKRKAKARGEDHVELCPPKLAPIPEPKTTPVDKLCAIHGDRLRLAVEPDAIFEAITGSHIRSSKMSPMVYSALQIITRGRDNGISVVELGRQSGYDQKTCFYLVRQLTELGLVVKVRRGGVGTHFCIHRYFFERSSSWKAIRDEETLAENLQGRKQSIEPDVGEEEEVENLDSLNFTPIDARHLSSLPLISGRVVKLLMASRNHMHASNNMLITLGFSNPTKTDRRFFQSRIREMIQQRLIEKVVVPSNKRKSMSKSVKCFRLVKQEPATPGESTLVLSDADEDVDDLANAQGGIKLNATIHKQIIDQLEESGTRGMTLNELSASLCQFDKRTIELLLARADKCHPPTHLADLRIASLMETSGRERRHRYFTVANYLQLVQEEELDKSSVGYEGVDLAQTGGFQLLQAGSFYEEELEVIQFSDTFKDNDKKRVPKLKNFTPKNPILPNGKVKRGRPRKVMQEEEDTSLLSKGAKRKLANIKESPAHSLIDSDEPPTKKSRSTLQSFKESSVSLAKRGRGRPRKTPALNVQSPSIDDTKSPSSELPDVVLNTGRNEEDAGNEGPYEGPPTVHPIARVQEPVVLRSGADQVAAPGTEILDSNTDLPYMLPADDSGVGPQDASPPAQGYPDRNEANAALIRGISSQDPQPEMSTSDLPEESSHRRTPLQTGPGDQMNCAASAVPGVVSARINVSQLRRENELLKLVENAGGIINIQTKEFYQSHMKLLEVLAKAGESTSAPVGTKTDKRTVTSTFNSLESKGRVKQLRTTVTTATGASRPACIIYLPDVDQTRINDYLATLARSSQQSISHLSSFVKIENQMDYGAGTTPGSRGILPLQLLQMEQPAMNEKERWSKNVDRAQQLFSHEDATIREVLLAERTTLAQAYGFIVGKALRCRELHLTAITAFETRVDSPNIVSYEKRIIDLSFFCLDLPLHMYCALVSPLTFDENLLDLLAQGNGREIPVRDLPQPFQAALQLGKSRARSRILDLLEVLRSLKLVIPLQPSASELPFLACQQNGNHPASFDVACLEGWTASSPIAAPTYWQFLDSAPIHLYAQSETDPPLWKTVQTSTRDSALKFWDELREACTNSKVTSDDTETSFSGSKQAASVSTIRSLRRAVSWKSDYFLTWHQVQYLKQFIDNTTLSTPLQIADEKERQAKLNKIHWVTTAPLEVIVHHFTASREKLLKTQERMKEKAKKVQKRAEETKLSLAKKAEEARIQRGREWDKLLEQVHPDALSGPASLRIERLRTQFLQSGSVKDTSRWDKEIRAALREADLVSNKALKITSRRPLPVRPVLSEPVVTTTTTDSSIQSLIELQGPPLQEVKPPVKRKRKMDSTGPESQKKVTRRHRFHWTPEFDELARDASVIIRARCRTLSRLDWAAFEQVFPAVPRNTVRQRLTHIRETPGNEAYLRRLEDTWYDLWCKFRGTPLLPDEDPQSASNFDLIKHIEFLRTHVDKNAIRVGFAHAKESAEITIPSSVADLYEHFDVVSADKAAPEWDFMWNALIEEGREKKLKRAVLSRCPEDFPTQRLSEPDDVALAEATLKMVMSTPPERYDVIQGSVLLRQRGADLIDTAKRNLLSRGILSKSQRDPEKQGPGRQLKISESNQNAIGGLVSQDTFQDAVSLLDAIGDDIETWHQWPLTATDGDCATLIELASEDRVDFNIDTSVPQAARPSLDWNSKKADDDQIETGISVRYRLGPSEREWSVSETQATIRPMQVHSPSPDPRIEAEHGANTNDDPACCRKATSQGLVDCLTCLNDGWTTLQGSMDPKDEGLASWLIDLVRQQGESGVKKSDIMASAGSRASLVPKIVRHLTEADIPQVYWVGYDSLVLVSAHYIKKWAVTVSKSPVIHVFPRRWLDVKGIQVFDFWQSALRAVMGLIIFRPGMTQAEIGWRLRAVYDRQELTDILRFLHGEGYVQYRLGFSSEWTSHGWDVVFDEDEERKVFWFIGEKQWYQV